MPNQKRVFIIHGWGGNPGEAWFPWLVKNLADKGFLVEVPKMPDTDNPKIEAWTGHIQKTVGQCDENTFFVGHSIGCQAIMRYLEKLPYDEKALLRQGYGGQAGGAVFVAGWFTLTGLEEEEERMTSSLWVNTPIDFEKAKARAKKFICIFSDNDPYVPAENWEMFSKKLGAEIIIEKNKGHFTDDDGIKELPAALDAVLKIAIEKSK
ncbi:MAG: alpha/beta hydrolase [Candidatus Moraniibacteriota bacterium]